MTAAADLIPKGGLTIDQATGALLLGSKYGVRFSADEFLTLCSRAGRNAEPYLLKRAWGLRVIAADVATAAIAGAWSGPDFPQRSLDRRDWLRLFAVAGFTVDGRAAARPPRPMTLYRGCDRCHRLGFSWTTDLEIAVRFARRFYADQQHGFSGGAWRRGYVYEADVPPGAMLCIPGSEGRPEEAEYVIDTRALSMREATR